MFSSSQKINQQLFLLLCELGSKRSKNAPIKIKKPYLIKITTVYPFKIIFSGSSGGLPSQLLLFFTFLSGIPILSPLICVCPVTAGSPPVCHMDSNMLCGGEQWAEILVLGSGCREEGNGALSMLLVSLCERPGCHHQRWSFMWNLGQFVRGVGACCLNEFKVCLNCRAHDACSRGLTHQSCMSRWAWLGDEKDVKIQVYVLCTRFCERYG